jgi:hypothetical protein
MSRKIHRRASAQRPFVRVCAGSVACAEISQPAIPADAHSSDASAMIRERRVRSGNGGASETSVAGIKEGLEDALPASGRDGLFQSSFESHGPGSIWGQL